jgi:uncharacterized surface protein with fasciclin (FAS1) repeats
MKTRLFSRIGAVGAVALSLGLGACSDDPELSIFETLEGDARFSTLVTAVTAAGLDDELSTGGPFTLFAPTNAAFAALPAGVLDAVLADVDLLTDILLYHVASGTTLSSGLSNGQTIPTLLTGATLSVSIMGGTVEINDATVTQADLEASNGVIHVIDGVLVPELASFSAIVAEIERQRKATRQGATTRSGLGDEAQNGLDQ